MNVSLFPNTVARTMRAFVLLGALPFALAAFTGCGGDSGDEVLPNMAPTITLSSQAFSDGGDIPREFSCDGSDLSPALAWQGAPAGTAAFALIVDDPDAGSFVHWLVYDIPVDVGVLDEAASPGGQLPSGSKEGRNSFNAIGYDGPCPPAGKLHRYSFRIYALDAPLDLERGATRKELDRAMEGHILARGELVALYERPST